MKILYIFIQCTWGCLQTLLGLGMFIKYRNCKHYTYHHAIVTEIPSNYSVSLGLFIFITKYQLHDLRKKHRYPYQEMNQRLLVHEYGHTIQSLILGPFYLICIGIPSALYARLPYYQNKRSKGLAYGTFFTEKSANHLGEIITKEKSLEDAVI